MTDYIAPKVDWTSSDGLAFSDLNRIEGDIVYLKALSDDTVGDLDDHIDETTIHKTSVVTRTESTTALVIEVRTTDPAAPAIGQIWLNTSV
jgi:hypothetical protein